MGLSLRSATPVRRDVPADPPVVSIVEHVPVVALSGDLDLVAVEAVTAAVRSACLLADRTLVIDLSGVDFVDVVGVHALERAHAACFAEGVSMVVAGASPTVARMLSLVGGPHGAVLPLVDSVGDAVSSVETRRRLLTG
jgi:anti-anti-sigma factor